MTVWLSRELILAVHDEQLAEHGGATGIREEGLLESALARPLNRAAYGDPDIAELAAVFALGLVKVIRSSTGTSGPPMSPWSCSSG